MSREIWEKVSVSGLSPEQARSEKHEFARLCATGKKMCRLVAGGNFPHLFVSAVD